MKECSVENCAKVPRNRGLCPTHYTRFRRHGDPNKVMVVRHAGTDAERFWAKVERGEGCWLWSASKSNGYGLFMTYDRRKNMAHRLAYELTIGPIPDGHQIDHICHNRACVNPDHLRLATNKQNNENASGLRSTNTSGYRGVSFNKRSNRYVATAHHNGLRNYGGAFTNPEEAGEAARQLRLSLYTHNVLDRKAS